MPADVGGRLEAVPGRKSLFGPDYLRLAVLAAAALAVHGWLVAHTAVPARDGLTYARFALNLSDPNVVRDTDAARARVEVVRTAEQPPGYPAAVWAAEKALRAGCDLPLPDRVLLAAQLVNAAAAVLLVVPMYLTGRILFGRNVGFAAALLFQVLPVPARVTSDALSEGLYLLCVSSAVLFGVRAVRRPGVGGFLLCGLAAGASYLVRPEGLLAGVAVGLVVAAAAVGRYWPRDRAAARLAALAVGVGLVAVPYAALIGKLTNKPTGKFITTPLDTGPAPIWRGQPNANAGGAAGPLFAEWWDPKRDEGKNRAAWAVAAVGKEMVKSLHYVVGALALFGVVARRRQLLLPDPGPWVLLALGGLNLLLLVYLAARIGYVSERHTVLATMLCCTFAAAALRPLADALGAVAAAARVPARAGAGGMLLALVAAALPYTLKPMHPQREGHKHAGRWLAAHAAADDAVVDPLAWAEWYAGRTLYTRKHALLAPVTWVVVERGKTSPHSRLPLWDLANDLAAAGQLAYRWPEGGSADGPVVEVYRVAVPADALKAR
ncbi:MAG: hypothetical protein C0501_20880 [Isosphaera sp.]|nr:hypothetical protein [Isosphaera sp.]